MSRTLSPYQIDVILEHLQTRKQILTAVHGGVQAMNGQEEREDFLKLKIDELDEIIKILEGVSK